MTPELMEGRSAAPEGGAPPVGRLVDVSGRRLFVHTKGSGGPVVVILPGAGAIGLDYLNVFERIAEHSATVLYDRGGTGWSDAADLPRSAPEVVDELRALLEALGAAPPYLLVGHSLGGAFARHFAQRFPAEVAGLLLLDPAHEELDAHYPQEVRELFAQFVDAPIPDFPPEMLELWRGVFADKLQRWPEGVRGPLIVRHVERWRAGFLEGQKTEALVYEPLRRAGGLPDVPLIVLSAMGIDASPTASLPEGMQRGVNGAKQAVNRLLAGSVPRGEERELDGATHVWMHIEQEDSVVAALVDLIGRICA